MKKKNDYNVPALEKGLLILERLSKIRRAFKNYRHP